MCNPSLIVVPPDAVAVTFVMIGEEEEVLLMPILRPVPPVIVIVTFVMIGEELAVLHRSELVQTAVEHPVGAEVGVERLVGPVGSAARR